MTPLDLKALEELASAATHAPWQQDEDNGEHRIYGGIFSGAERAVVEIADVWATEDGKRAANAAFIAAARTAFPALISRVRELEGENARLCERDAILTGIMAWIPGGIALPDEHIDNIAQHHVEGGFVTPDEDWLSRVKHNLTVVLLRARTALRDLEARSPKQS